MKARKCRNRISPLIFIPYRNGDAIAAHFRAIEHFWGHLVHSWDQWKYTQKIKLGRRGGRGKSIWLIVRKVFLSWLTRDKVWTKMFWFQTVFFCKIWLFWQKYFENLASIEFYRSWLLRHTNALCIVEWFFTSAVFIPEKHACNVHCL